MVFWRDFTVDKEWPQKSQAYGPHIHEYNNKKLEMKSYVKEKKTFPGKINRLSVV